MSLPVLTRTESTPPPRRGLRTVFALGGTTPLQPRRGASSVRLIEHRVVRVGGHDGELAALPPEHLGPEPFRLREERVRRLASEHVPGPLLDLRPQLARAPARVPREDPQRGDAPGEQLGR